MAKQSEKLILVGDFETTVYEGQIDTQVWASACVELFTEDVQIFHSIDETFNYLVSLNRGVMIYYHNLKFDGNFWLSFLMNVKKFKQATVKRPGSEYDVDFMKNNEMPNNSFKYIISDMGQWYSITIKVHNHIIELRDSLKLLPFSVKEIGKSFGTKHKKLDMEYKGFRYPGCVITDEEKKYIANDVLVVKEALEIMYEQSHTKMTIGACCLEEYKNITKTNGAYSYDELFPDVTEIPIPKEDYGSDNVDNYIRHSYKGGWCYVVEEKANQMKYKGTTADVNSLYPSMMHSQSGNKYPVGKPHMWKGNYIPDQALLEDRYFFIRIKTRFYIKANMLPFIQIKGSPYYKGTEMLRTSDRYDKITGETYSHYRDKNGNWCDTRVELTLTMTDYKLMLEHYELVDFEILDGCWFYSMIGIFDKYIDKYKKIKMESKGAIRTLAKLFLNNLYGKLASSKASNYKVAYLKEDGVVGFYEVTDNSKKPGYIPCGSAITSYARNFTIRAAQKNYYGIDKPGFIYADTDSIHCDLEPGELKGIKVDDNDFCCWKLESCWDVGLFVRQKTYVEHVTHENQVPINEPHYDIKCAGMPQRCKDYFLMSMQGYTPTDKDEFDEDVLEFLKTKRTLDDFKIGLVVPGKLLPMRIRGGVLLAETTYEMR